MRIEDGTAILLSAAMLVSAATGCAADMPNTACAANLKLSEAQVAACRAALLDGGLKDGGRHE